MSRSPQPNPDDWQQQAAQHQRAQMSSRVAKISRSSRRGNRIWGGFLMVVGLGVLVLSVVRSLELPTEELTWRELRGVLWLPVASLITIGTGLAIWRGRFTKKG